MLIFLSFMVFWRQLEIPLTKPFSLSKEMLLSLETKLLAGMSISMNLLYEKHFQLKKKKKVEMTYFDVPDKNLYFPFHQSSIWRLILAKQIKLSSLLMLWNDHSDFFLSYKLIIIIVSINTFPHFVPLTWFAHCKYDKIIPSSPTPAQLPEVRRTGFSPFVFAAHHWHLLLFRLCPCRLLHF